MPKMSFPKHARHNVLPPTHPNINSQKTTTTMSQTHNCRKCLRHRRRRHHKCRNQRHRHRHRRRPRRHRTKANSIMNKLNHENSIMKKLNHCLTEQQLHSQMSLPRIESKEIIQKRTQTSTHRRPSGGSCGGSYKRPALEPCVVTRGYAVVGFFVGSIFIAMANFGVVAFLISVLVDAIFAYV